MIVAGIDPGLASTGFGVVQLLAQQRRFVMQKTIRTDAEASLFDRCLALRLELLELLRAQAVVAVAFEAQLRAAHGHHARHQSDFNASKALVGLGVALGAVAELGVPAVELEPSSIRKAHGVPGDCSKETLLAVAPRFYSAWPAKLSKHAADAVVIAGAGAGRWAVLERFEAARTSARALQGKR